jgi:hypothetical protein
MQEIFLGSLLAGVAFAGAITASAQPLTVHVYDHVGVGQSSLEGAEVAAAAILQTAGVEFLWVNCRTRPERDCPNLPGPTEFILELMPASVTRRSAAPGALGYALPPDSGPFGSYAGVLYDRVKKSSSVSISETVLLAHAMAHELGHLLLGVGRHSVSGIMKADWGFKDLERAAQGSLAFTGRERSQIQKNVQRRLAEARQYNLARGK